MTEQQANQTVVVTGSFDNFGTSHARFLQEASRLGNVVVACFSDEVYKQIHGQDPMFPEQERMYVLNAMRYVTDTKLVGSDEYKPDTVPLVQDIQPDIWVIDEDADNEHKRKCCEEQDMQYKVLTNDDLRGFPFSTFSGHTESTNEKVMVTGSFDWFHSGHVRFFEEVSQYGDLYVVVGHDENIRRLKGEGHPLFPAEQRMYMVQAIRYVTGVLESTGTGWLDAAPELERIKPDIYAVNEDGDKPEKKELCDKNGIEYLVLKRKPKEGLPKRESTKLRGF